MKAKIIIRILGSAIFLLPYLSSGQQQGLKEMLKDKFTFREITETVSQYLATAPESYEKERIAKQFARWAYYQSFHLGPEGEFVNISRRTLDAVNQRKPLPADRSANGDWTFAGPASTYVNNPGADLLGNGRADRIVFHPTNSSIIYVGTPSGGLWKTTTGGSSWSCVASFIPSLGISGIVISNADPNTIYVLTGDGDTYFENAFLYLFGYVKLSAGVLVSHDAGVTWQQTGELSATDYTGYCLIQNPYIADILHAATSDGIYRTLDGGDTWTKVYSGVIYDLEYKPGDSYRMYASGVGTFIYSTNRGSSWLTNSTFDYPLCENPSGSGRVDIAVTPAAPNNVYLLAGPWTANNQFCGFYRSLNSGGSFTRMTNTPNVLGDEEGDGDQSRYDLGLTVRPDNSQVIITGGLIIYKSTNGGSTFSHATHYRESGGTYIHPDIHFIAYNPLNNYLYAAGDGGFHRSTDDGATWADLYNGLNTAQFYHLDDYDANQYALLAGCQDNGVKFKTTNTTSFAHIYCCDGGDAAINYSYQYQGFAVVNTSIQYFSHFTNTAPVTITSVYNSFFPQIELNTSDPLTLYYSYGTIKKYVIGVGTSDLNTAALGFWALKTCPSNASRIYAAGGTSAWDESGEMYLTSDGGSSWSTISNNTGFPYSFPRISDIGVRPTNSLYVYACLSGYTDGLKVLYSSNAGSSWSNISYDLPNLPVWSIEVDDNNNLYIGTDAGVYYKASGATEWEPFYNYLPNVPVTDLAINQTSDQLLAATFGRGIWKTTLRETCPATYAVISNVSGKYFRSASTSVTMNSDVVGGEGSYAVLRAGDYVDLLPGFQVNGDPGNKFLAYIGSCDSGLPPDYAGQVPVYPMELLGYNITYSRQEGTLEVPVVSGSGQKSVVLRLFSEGKVRILLAGEAGKYLRDIAGFEGKQGTYIYTVDTTNLTPGMYYIYLIVNDQVVHLQEMEVL